MISINRNVSIVVIILVLVVIAGYLVWIRSKYQPPVSPETVEQVSVTPTDQPAQSASPSATPGTKKEATGSMKQKTSTASSAGK